MSDNGAVVAEPTEADRLQARGRTIVLTDGSEVAVRFTFSVLAAIERRFGGIASFVVALAADLTGEYYAAVLGCMEILTGRGTTDLEAVMDTAAVFDYALAIDDALSEALPPPPADDEDDDTGKAEAPPSPGATSTT